MKLPKSILWICVLTFIPINGFSQLPGSYDIDNYVPFLKNQNIGVVANHNSTVINKHLIDTLISLDLNIKCIFSPEHGFSGSFNAGEYVNDSLYNGDIPIISLYGKNKELNDSDLNDIDFIIFDIQDVGVRFYTYISTLHYVMEGCARNNISLILLDRPNPHAHYVDGPVLKKKHVSFVGMHPVPIVYGMTIGEYALMINGEGWLKNNLVCNLIVVKIQLYSRYDEINYEFSSPPSPNLPNMNSISLYPSLCLFEGTLISVGRGTDYPFEVFGAPFFNKASISPNFHFTPSPNFGSSHPKYNGELCYGWSFAKENNIMYKDLGNIRGDQLNLNFLIHAYNNTPSNKKSIFFNSFFDNLAGNSDLKKQIIQGVPIDKIRKSWEYDIRNFKKIRKKYLLYN